jgi:transposase
MSYDEKFHTHVLRAKEQKRLNFSKVAERFGIAKQTVYNWTKRIEEKKTRNRFPHKIFLKVLAQNIEMPQISINMSVQSGVASARTAFGERSNA